MSTWTALNMPHLHNLEWDPREEHQVDFPQAWVLQPVAAAAGAFLKTLVAEPPIKPGTPDPYTPPKPGELRAEDHLVGARPTSGGLVVSVRRVRHPHWMMERTGVVGTIGDLGDHANHPTGVCATPHNRGADRPRQGGASGGPEVPSRWVRGGWRSR
jgi:hypothetical protein